VRFGPVNLLSKAKEGSWYELEPKEIKALYEDVKLPFRAASPMKPRDREKLERQARKRPRVRRQVESPGRAARSTPGPHNVNPKK
jgi:hypothetical protein